MNEWVWSTGRIILTRKIQNTQRKTWPIATLSTTDLAYKWTWESVVSGPGLTVSTIQADIQSLLAKMENIEDLNMNQMEMNISWTKVASLKHNKRKCKRQTSSDPLYLT